MDRRKFLSLSGLSLAAGCSGSGGSSGDARSRADGKFYPPVVQRMPLGHRVIHDRWTFLEQYKYEHWDPGRAWKNDSDLTSEFAYQWGACTQPIQRTPMRIIPGLYALGPDDYHQRIYLWETGDGLLLIDPSYDRFQPLVETQIRQLGYGLDEVKAVLLTHMHWDHGESAHSWEQRGVPVHISEKDAPYITGQIQDPNLVNRVKNPVTFGDNQTLRFGGLEMKTILTPGHTPGSTCFSLVWEDTNVLISGDIALHWGRHAWMGADYCDWDQYLASLWKLYQQTVSDDPSKCCEMMLPGHGTIDLDGARDSIHAVLQVVSYIIRQRRNGSDIDWIDPHHLFWERKLKGEGEIVPLKS